MRVRAICAKRPVANWSAVLGRKVRDRFRPGLGEMAFAMNGRVALYRALRCLGFDRGDRVLVPAYHCESMVEPVLTLGSKIVYYSVREDLSLDLDEISELLAGGARGIIAVHYFGIPGPIAELKALCQAHGSLLIEDCCHALYGSVDGVRLGSFGDAAVFSFRKTLPVYDGGGFVLNRPAIRPDSPSRHRNWRHELRSLSQTFEDLFHPVSSCAMDLPPDAPAVPAAGASGTVAADSRFDPASIEIAMSGVAGRIARRSDPGSIQSRRLRNYRVLKTCLGGIDGVVAVGGDPGAGACPMAFPLTSSGHTRVDNLLRRARIPASCFGEKLHPTLEERRFPGARFLSAHLAALPVHQDLGESDLEILADAVRSVLKDR